MEKEITLIALSLLIGLCSCEKGTEAVKKELTGSKKIALSEYQKLDRKKRVEIFNQLEMSNRFELLKTILLNNGNECRIGPDGGIFFRADGSLNLSIPEGEYLNRWKIDSKGLTVYNDNTKKLTRLEDYLGKTHTTYNTVYWEEFSGGGNRYSLIFESEKTAEDGAAGYSMLGCDP
ncbi:putative lipoprotein [Leptospira santarosai str. CBC1531]|uniref:Lipoprotein n=1 Tax=Leptospira santarosai str. MOR084 TaxID=1049984 RepID=A0A0E2BC46_9LEPT|nr:hypothetical protein [Leptospira santarosai]EKO32479.1 putative lipoprotein [Leptospira santarosai str. MOR084]EMP81630.1 putative lipoprotein [Leptospira santarosai str. CBC1531]